LDSLHQGRSEAIMANSDSQFAGSIPELYDRYLGPVIFQPYADDLARRVAAPRPQAVLETAAGTGIVTRAMLAALPGSAAITATDLNQPMLDHGARQTSSSRVTWRQADALSLPFDGGSFDAVVCQFGAMFFPDKIAAYREARRVLKQGGSFVFNVWGPIARNEFADVITKAVAALFPDDPPSFLPRIPYGYHDVGVIRRELESAGFSSVKIETLDVPGVAQSARHPAIGFCQGTPLRNEIETRDPARLGEATEAAAAALAARFGSGAVRGNLQARIIEARR
jgi:ubiquinone/menaquinone biosynthesis C-methylase UbiE